jgi:hypothetical protein
MKIQALQKLQDAGFHRIELKTFWLMTGRGEHQGIDVFTLREIRIR